MTTGTDPAQTAETLSAQWHHEHASLRVLVEQVRQWSYDVGQRGIPHFGEAADRLKRLRERLCVHFDREDNLVEQFAAANAGQKSPETEGNRRQVTHDHATLLSRLDDLIGKLGKLEPPFASWQQATEQIELWFDALEQHEEQEHDSITWLKPRKTT